MSTRVVIYFMIERLPIVGRRSDVLDVDGTMVLMRQVEIDKREILLRVKL